MNILAILVPISGVIALLFALGYALSINKKSPGNERMREIADAISTGAKAFLFSEYKNTHCVRSSSFRSNYAFN